VYLRHDASLNKWRTGKIRTIADERYICPYQVSSSRPTKISLPGNIGMGAFKTILELVHNHRSRWLTVKYIILCGLGYKDSNAADRYSIHFHDMDMTWRRHVSSHWLVYHQETSIAVSQSPRFSWLEIFLMISGRGSLTSNWSGNQPPPMKSSPASHLTTRATPSLNSALQNAASRQRWSFALLIFLPQLQLSNQQRVCTTHISANQLLTRIQAYTSCSSWERSGERSAFGASRESAARLVPDRMFLSIEDNILPGGHVMWIFWRTLC
jgi:hypothetical protein